MATMVENEGRAVDDQELVIIEGEEKDEEEQLREEKINENEKEKEGEQKNNSEKEINQMPLYSKFLKDLLTKKSKYIHSDNIVVEGNCSTVIQRILPPKHKDPGSVTIPCSIGSVSVGKALIDLGASINLMPLPMCRRLGELEIMPTGMTLQLANRSIVRPYGVIEDVLVKVKQITFPADFVVMDLEEEAEIPLILGCPFLSTASCVVDMNVTFDLFEAMKHPNDNKAYFKVEKVEDEIDMVARAMVLQSPLEKALNNTVECLTMEEEKEVQTCLEELDGVKEKSVGHVVFEELKNNWPTEKAKVELKTLPEHLKYVFLGENEANPVIINSSLRMEEEDQLVKVLKKHKVAIGWHISDLKGINLSYCMHKINMEADYKPVR
ncbi:uncharacterized protein LOC114411130 [Glycine soja]|uniref:uncharacterized protein n=1 Tax=Glycine max TaxID=3847 RepID=UPI0003DEB013|nr:uncharacterized protein LOC100807926 [Glycine max]XP_028230687.1 uncharacterized protein LOC114411130 [Glycine soja]|eukprot:XP_006580727.1 uncharacterized protein LOC100807926 [Glycine max]